jgi:hypothetical protein
MPLTSNHRAGMPDFGSQPFGHQSNDAQPKQSQSHGSDPSTSNHAMERYTYRILPKVAEIQHHAAAMEELLCQQLLHPDPELPWVKALEQYPRLKYLNNFGTQIVIRMLRSAYRFQGFKIDFSAHVLKPHVLFVLSTLVSDADLAHTSPLAGLKALDIGCGALSSYVPADQDSTVDMLTQFYLDHPPVLAELLQLLGAQTFGVDPREYNPQAYDYTPTYRHLTFGFTEVEDWLQKLRQPMDLICCFNLFNRGSFEYHYGSPRRISQFFQGLKSGLSPQGLVFTSAPLLPSSADNIAMNRRIFTNAGFRVVYTGYYTILEPRTPPHA